MDTLLQDTGTTSGLAPHRVLSARAYVARSLGGPLRVDAIAAAVGLSPFHFARMYKQATGEAPHAYVTRVRIDQAKQLLAETSMPLMGVARQVGFRTQAHFTGVFRKLTGTTPRAFRRASRALLA
jgi:AraC family transcriptional regulator